MINRRRRKPFRNRGAVAVIVGILLLVALIVGLVLLLTGGKSIVGTWKHDSVGATYVFDEQNQVSITLPGQQEPYRGTYELNKKEKTLSLSYQVGEDTLSQVTIYRFQGRDKLELTSPDTGSVVTMTRQKVEP